MHRFWQRRPLATLGMVIHLGHGGEKCPQSSDEPRDMVMVGIHGIQTARVQFCRCTSQPAEASAVTDIAIIDEAAQLITFGYWPASYVRPETAFSLDLMNLFQLMSNQANTNAFDFMKVLARRTDNVLPQLVRVSKLLESETLY